jgi:hypothetical protein
MRGPSGISAVLNNVSSEIETKLSALDPIVSEHTPRATELHKRNMDYYNSIKKSMSTKAGPTAPTTVEEGKVYEDASGRKAKLVNGKWVAVP